MKANIKTISIIIGIFLMLVGIMAVNADYFEEVKIRAFNDINMQCFLLKKQNYENIISNEEIVTDVVVDEPIVSEIVDDKKTTTDPVEVEDYIAILEIPKLSIKRGLYEIGSVKNNVDKNVKIMSYSNYPDVERGNFVLAGHSGTGSRAYFKNLHKLEIGDYAYVYFKGIKYSYVLVNKYYQARTGHIALLRDYSKTVLTLVTCTYGDKSSQTVMVLELQVREEY